MAESMHFGLSDSLKQQHVNSHNVPMNHAPEYSEVDAWISAQHTGHINEKTTLWSEDDSQSSCQDMQYLNDIRLLKSSSVHFFITDIFIEAASEYVPKDKAMMSSRRCLIDTGADVNMITLNSLQGLQSEVQPFSGCVHGAGGRAEVIALAKLNWHLKSRFFPSAARRPDLFGDFLVVDPAVPYDFDCVLGRPWIQKHILFFTWICLKQRFLTRNASNTTAHIAAIADGQEKTVQLPRTRYDSALRKSIISKDHARATKGTIKACPELSLVDSTGRTYTSRATTSVRWHASGGAQSFSETFYLVDSLGQYDAMLRRDIARADTADGMPHVYAFVMEKESQAEKEMKKAKERARVKEMEAAKARSEGRVRAQYEQKKGELARERG